MKLTPRAGGERDSAVVPERAAVAPGCCGSGAGTAPAAPLFPGIGPVAAFPGGQGQPRLLYLRSAGRMSVTPALVSPAAAVTEARGEGLALLAAGFTCGVSTFAGDDDGGW